MLCIHGENHITSCQLYCMFSSVLGVSRFPLSRCTLLLLGPVVVLWTLFYHTLSTNISLHSAAHKPLLCALKTIIAWYFLHCKTQEFFTISTILENTTMTKNIDCFWNSGFIMSQDIDRLWSVWFTVTLMSFLDREWGCCSSDTHLLSQRLFFCLCETFHDCFLNRRPVLRRSNCLCCSCGGGRGGIF